EGPDALQVGLAVWRTCRLRGRCRRSRAGTLCLDLRRRQQHPNGRRRTNRHEKSISHVTSCFTVSPLVKSAKTDYKRTARGTLARRPTNNALAFAKSGITA